MQASEGFLTAADGVRLYFRTVGDGSRSLVFPNGVYLAGDFAPLANGRRLIFYDVRNRGESDAISDTSKLKRGIHNDVDDLDAVRRHFGIEKLDVIGHSYMGVMVALYAMKYPDHTNRVVQIGPAEPEQGKQYAEHLTCNDAKRAEVLGRVGQMMQERPSGTPVEICKKFWAILRELYVVDPANAHRTDWGRCDLPTELNFMSYWISYMLPSLQALKLTPEDFARAHAPVLTIHGRKDRSAPYGGGRDWALRIPNARLVTVENGAHAPWIEEPDRVFGAIEAFLDGAWPESAEKVEALEMAG
jgi:proline iminopeptidase